MTARLCNKRRHNGVQNPVLSGFNPDPSIIRVLEDYYIATSTFEWFPGVQIHHSCDLSNWKLITRPLDRLSLLDLRGVDDSAGIFAPCLSHSDGTFYLVFTVVRALGQRFMDSLNNLVTAPSITGPWSEPVFLNSSGFDPSLFHDDDGKKWLVTMSWNYRGTWNNAMAGIELTQYDPKLGKLTGPSQIIYEGDGPEGPHLYQRNGYYYLITAEGGTHYGHKVCIARSRSINGPYESYPGGPILSSAENPEHPLQKAGHADLVETPDGETYMCYHAARPLSERGRCPLGRETAIQKMNWTRDHWLQTCSGTGFPQLTEESLPSRSIKERHFEKDDFVSPLLKIQWQSLRQPLGEDTLSLKERPGFLRLKGAESPQSLFNQALVARRQQAITFSARTCLECDPDSYKQMAGLLYWYNTSNFYYLRVSHDETIGRCLSILAMDNQNPNSLPSVPIGLPEHYPIELRADIDRDRLQFSYGINGSEWIAFGPALDASICSDDYGRENGTGWFTGAFIGLGCHDLTGRRLIADFDWFSYEER